MIDYSKIIRQVIIERAREAEYHVNEHADVLLEQNFRTQNIVSKLNGELTSRDVTGAKHLDMHALSIGSCSILIASLDEPSTSSATLRKCYTQAGIARGWLGAEDVDLYLLLNGPFGSHSDERWQLLASSVERDESICRKLVWLPSDEERLETVHREAEHFCDRTFLARPWLSGQGHVQHDLDAIGAIYEKLSVGFRERTQLSGDVLKRWLVILEKPEDPQQIAHKLFLASKDL